jgi:hypothetical protein
MIGRDDLLERPFDVCAELADDHPLIVGQLVSFASVGVVQLELRIAPPLELAPHGYPIESVRIIQARTRDVPVAFPTGSEQRQWYHRNPDGTLCLWYPADPEQLRWTWKLGFSSYVALVERHLIFEERHRRGHPWPMPDAPHGIPADASILERLTVVAAA